MPASTQGLDRVVLQIAPGRSVLDHPAIIDWFDAGSRRVASPLGIKAGRDDEASTVEAGSMSADMDDRDGNLSSRNPMGTWYGLLNRGTPARITWNRTGDDFARAAVATGWGTNADGYEWSVGNAAVMSTDGTRGVTTLSSGAASFNYLIGTESVDSELVWSFTCPVMPTGQAFICAGVFRRTDASNYLRAHVELQPSGDVDVKIMRVLEGATTTLVSNVTVTTATAGTKIWGRARMEGSWLLVKTWTGNRADEPPEWHADTTDNTLEGTKTGVFPWRFNTNAGTFTAYVDDIEIVNILWAGSIPAWPVRWPDKSGNDSITPVVGAGVLRRIQRTGAAVQSPLRMQLGKLTYGTGYLPLEDAQGTTAPASGLSGGLPGQAIGVEFAADDTLPGSDPCATLTTVGGASRIWMPTNQTATDGFAVLLLFKCPTAVPSTRVLMDIRVPAAAARWAVTVDATSYGFVVHDESGAIVANNTALYGSVSPLDWVAIQLETSVSAGTVTTTLLWHQVGESTFLFTSDTHTGNAAQVNGVFVYPVVDGMSAAHLWAGDDALPFVDPDFSGASNGWLGELAADRIARLCEETRTPVIVMAGDTEPMGRQRSGKLMDLLRECESADLGILFERGNSLAYRPRTRRYNAPVALALDWSLGHLHEPPEPEDDDQRLENRIIVNRVDGAQGVVAEDSDSVYQEGPYEQTYDLVIETDERAVDFATWLRHLGTANELRWPRITINLVAHPELIAGWLSCVIGSRITIANPPTQILGQVIDLFIEGYEQTINVDQWLVTLSCTPAAPWTVGVYDSDTSLWDLRSTVTDAEVSAAATTITVVTTEDEPLSPTSTYGIMIEDELITVPIGGAAARTGTPGDWTQVLSGLTRGVNGVNKILRVAAPVTIHNHGRWAA